MLTRVNGSAAAANELRQIQEAVAEETGTLRELLQPGLRRAFWIAVSLAILQQITGINTVLFYGSIIFKEHVAHQSDTSAVFANVVVGAVNFLMTLVALGLIDKLGRRPLLMISTAAMAVCQAALGLAFLMNPPPAMLVLAIMLCCVAAFAVGLGPGFWVLLSEIFPTRIRGRAMSIATICLWIACTVLTMTFLSLVKAVSATGAFLVYSGMCVGHVRDRLAICSGDQGTQPGRDRAVVGTAVTAGEWRHWIFRVTVLEVTVTLSTVSWTLNTRLTWPLPARLLGSCTLS